MTLQQDSSEGGAAGERQEPPLSRPNGILVGELVAYLTAQDQDLPVAAACGCHGGWSTAAKTAYVDSGTATSNKPHVKIGWGS